jgi:hypothetical protein
MGNSTNMYRKRQRGKNYRHMILVGVLNYRANDAMMGFERE